MKRLEYTVTFHTPAFLGNAAQSGQWRTPPFKALLRQWWRVVYMKDCFAGDVPATQREEGLQTWHKKMRHEEGRLFGHAWLEDDHEDGRAVAGRRSLLRLRLDRWDEGRLKSWDKLEQAAVYHPEVERVNFRIGPHAYLGYGPLVVKGGTILKANAAIQAGERATLSIAVPEAHAPRIEHALWLMDRYGTLGGRSRNGWGSFSLHPLSQGARWSESLPLRQWQEALKLDWPHAIGRDNEGALIWQTAPHDDWKALMKTLAIVKIGLRTQFVFNTGKDAQFPEARHWLSYPVTNHNVAAWKEKERKRDFRLPNTLRFKIRRDSGEPAKFVGVIFHMPCLPPPDFRPNQQAIKQVWQSVHGLLDELTAKPSVRRYEMIKNQDRRAQLKPQLDQVTLMRIPE